MKFAIFFSVYIIARAWNPDLYFSGWFWVAAVVLILFESRFEIEIKR